MLPGKDEAEIEELLNAAVEEGMVDIGIQADPVFEHNGAKGRLGIENIAANHYAFQVDLILEDTGETVYRSGLISPGYYIEYVSLERELEAGDRRRRRPPGGRLRRIRSCGRLRKGSASRRS